VLGLPLLIALCAICVIWIRGRSTRVDVDAHKRATAPWL
jgi:hypothetical protein